MRKFIFTFLALFLASSIFAIGDYHGDGQFAIGYRFAAIESKVSENYNPNSTITKSSYGNLSSSSNNIYSSLSNYNLWMFNYVGSFGLFEKLEFTHGKGDSFIDTRMSIHAALGPAIATYFLGITEIRLGVGLAVGWEKIYTIVNDTLKPTDTVGIGLIIDGQMKLFPFSDISPVFGLQYNLISLSKVLDDINGRSNYYNAATVYAGVAVNFDD